MNLALLSFIAGLLTVLSPCVLPLLPVILGGSTSEKSLKAPVVVIASLGVSIFAFTMLLRVSTALIMVPTSFWDAFSGAIIALVGASLVFPHFWTQLSAKMNLAQKSYAIQSKGESKSSNVRNIFLGLSLGPIFTSCSPTFGIIIATVLPASWARGVTYLLLYILGLLLVLFAVAIGGQKVTSKLKWAAEENSKFRKAIGIVLVVVGVLIATGTIREIEIWWASSDFNLLDFELGLLE